MKRVEFYTWVDSSGHYAVIENYDLVGRTRKIRLPFDCEPGERVKITFETIDKPEKK